MISENELVVGLVRLFIIGDDVETRNELFIIGQGVLVG
jgi:hypothetical protein